jgi:hypothetical protein
MTTSNTPMNPLDKLAHHAALRTARTDQLHNATVALFAKLRELVPVGTSVQVGNVSVGLNKVRSNIGSDVCWSAWVGNEEDGYGCSDIERPVDFNGYLHGDFNCPVDGPSRQTLIAVGKAAPALVAALVTKTEKTLANLDTALANVNTASATL